MAVALPELLVPDGTPAFLVSGHSIDEADLFANLKRSAGHGRKRRLYTVSERKVAVSLLLDQAQMATFDAWFENALLVGSIPFSAKVASQDGAGSQYWRAVWDAPYTADPMPLGRWLVSGVLLLTGEGSDAAPPVTTAKLAVRLPLTGSASMAVPAFATLAFTVALQKPQTAPPISFGMALTKYLGSGSELREDGSVLLREDGTKVRREGGGL